MPNYPGAQSDRPTLLLMVVTGVGAFLAAMDISQANGLLPSLGASFGISSRTTLSWVITLYAIVFAAALVPAGRLADRYGRRATFVWGLAIVAAGSVLCAGAWNLPAMLVGRALQALGASAASPVSIALLTAAVTPGARQIYAARWAGAGALGIASGPIVGAATTDLASWRAAFGVSAAIAVLALVAFHRVGTSPELLTNRSMPDPLSALLLLVAAGTGTAGISGMGEWGVASTRAVLLLLTAAMVTMLFIRRCRKARDPILDLGLLRRREIAGSTAVTLLYSIAFFGLLYSFMEYLRDQWQVPLLTAGLAMLPIPVSVLLLTVRIGASVDRRGFRLPVIVGLLVMGSGLLLTTAVTTGDRFHIGWLLALTVVGVGSGMSFPLLNAAAISATPSAHLAAVSAVNQCSRQIGAALGISTTVMLLGPVGATVSRYHLSWIFDAGTCAVAAVCGVALPGPRKPRMKRLSAEAAANREFECAEPKRSHR